MDNGHLPSGGTVSADGAVEPPVRLGEAHAARILERAASLDAKHSSEIEVGQLREAAADAGISRDAFDQAMREVGGEPTAVADPRDRSLKTHGALAPATHGAARSPQPDFVYLSGLLRDLLGEEGQVTVVDDCIQWTDQEGLSVSVSGGRDGSTAAVSAEGRLRGRILALTLPMILPLLYVFILADAGELAAMGAFFAMLFTTALALVATTLQHRRERKALRKKAERIRKQLQRVLGLAPGDPKLEPGPDERR